MQEFAEGSTYAVKCLEPYERQYASCPLHSTCLDLHEQLLLI